MNTKPAALPTITLPSPLALVIASGFAGTIRKLSAPADTTGAAENWWVLGDSLAASAAGKQWLARIRPQIHPQFGSTCWGPIPDGLYCSASDQLPERVGNAAMEHMRSAWPLAHITMRRQFHPAGSGHVRVDGAVPPIPEATLAAARQAIQATLPPLEREMLKAVERSVEQALDFLRVGKDASGLMTCLTQLLVGAIFGVAWAQIDSPHGGSLIIHPEFIMTADPPEVRFYDVDGREAGGRGEDDSQGRCFQWRDGWAVFGLDFDPVPAKMVLHPGSLSVCEIRAETDRELREVMIGAYRREEEFSGAGRFVLDAGAEVVDHDERFGTLLRHILPCGEIIMVVKVTNCTAEADGSFHTHYLRVDPECRPLPNLYHDNHLGDPQPVSARAAVASTWGLRAEEFDPQVRT